MDTEDGVRIAGTRLGGERRAAIVLAHGLLGWRTKPRWRLLAESLSDRFGVFTMDLRGHGQSGGLCSAGENEMLDVRAVVERARAAGFEQVVTVGGSMGGVAVMFEAAAYRDVDAVVSISAPALWNHSSLKGARRANWLLSDRVGRRVARHVFGTEIANGWGDPPPPAEIVGKIAPVPLWIIHGSDDHFFSRSDAELLYERAGEPKRLSLLDGFGHAEDGFTPAFARVLADGIAEMLDDA